MGDGQRASWAMGESAAPAHLWNRRAVWRGPAEVCRRWCSLRSLAWGSACVLGQQVERGAQLAAVGGRKGEPIHSLALHLRSSHPGARSCLRGMTSQSLVHRSGTPASNSMSLYSCSSCSETMDSPNDGGVK